MRTSFALTLISVLLTSTHLIYGAPATSPGSGDSDAKRNQSKLEEYVAAVTHGAGFLPWQAKGISDTELSFRRELEQRKADLLAARMPVRHPVLLTDAQVEHARRNIATAGWAADWYKRQIAQADYVADQDDGYVARMIPELTPTNSYGFTCPNCVDKKSQEGVGLPIMVWDYHRPDVCSCRVCGQEYPSDAYPESARLVCPRSNQTFTYYLNDEERAHPDDRSGKYAWHWVNHPIHVSFTGVIRQSKIGFMIAASRSLALAYRMTGQDRYARRAIRILERMAHCYRNWLYHDYWDTVADCDPMYAAWHDKELPLEWKRHLCGEAYKNDIFDRVAMLQSYWGAGRIHPSTDSIPNVATLAWAYDSVYNAVDADGRSLWSDEQRNRVERDLLLEYEMGGEPFVGGADKATTVNNKAPAVYHAQAVVARCLGLPRLADTALRGYEAIRDQSFLFDGFSRESPAYTNMFLSQLVQVPEELHGFVWPMGLAGRQGVVDVYKNDPRLRLMFRAMLDQLRPDGRYPPLSDTMENCTPALNLVEIGLRRYPEYYDGVFPALSLNQTPSEYATLNLAGDQIANDKGLRPPEILFPGWQTAFLRHGEGPQASVLSMTFSPPGNHRHDDNLSVFYSDRGRTILGDHGYVGDMPVNKWIHGTLSHNLVVVDNAEQLQRSEGKSRKPQLRRMFTSPKLSLVEAASDAYGQCREYRRLAALVKGPAAQTFMIDIFRVKGGDRHDYRVFSELASSDAAEGRLEFFGLSMPPEPPLPQVGASLKLEDIFGLRDTRGVDSPPPNWQATWLEPKHRYRLWMLTPVDRVEASNGPGQENRNQPGRRVRYLDVVRSGKSIDSTFVAVHEPSGPDGTMPIQTVERLELPATAGPDAVAIRIVSSWGTYLVFSEFATPTQVAGVRFQGAFGVLNQGRDGERWLLAAGAGTFMADGLGFHDISSTWGGRIAAQTETQLTSESIAPHDWPTVPTGVTSYALVRVKDGTMTGFPVRSTQDKTISFDRFPLPPSDEFKLESVQFLAEKHL